jgi:hypothetical protein
MAALASGPERLLGLHFRGACNGASFWRPDVSEPLSGPGRWQTGKFRTPRCSLCIALRKISANSRWLNGFNLQIQEIRFWAITC